MHQGSLLKLSWLVCVGNLKAGFLATRLMYHMGHINAKKFPFGQNFYYQTNKTDSKEKCYQSSIVFISLDYSKYYVRYGIFTICTHLTSLPRKMAPKLRIAFLHVKIAKKTLHLLDIA